jgi:hypothetical protein
MNYLKKLFAPVALSICTLLASATANAASLNVHNDTDMPLASLYISPSWSDIFDTDLLGNRYIAPGESAYIEFQGGGDCTFDLRAVFVDGSEAVPFDHYGVDLCNITDWHITE